MEPFAKIVSDCLTKYMDDPSMTGFPRIGGFQRHLTQVSTCFNAALSRICQQVESLKLFFAWPHPSTAKEIEAFQNWRKSVPPATNKIKDLPIDSDNLADDTRAVLNDPNAWVRVSFPQDNSAIPIHELQNARAKYHSFTMPRQMDHLQERDIATLVVIGSVTLSNLRISELTISGGDRIVLNNVMVDTLRLQHLPAIDWSGGYLKRITWNNVLRFQKDFHLRGVHIDSLPSDERELQWLRYVRAALQEQNNGLTAGLFYAAELARRKHLEDWPSRLFAYA